MSDAILIARRTTATLPAVLADALHLGMPAYIDKWEAIFAHHPSSYPLLDDGVPDVERYLHSTRLPSEDDVAILRQRYVESQVERRSGAA